VKFSGRCSFSWFVRRKAAFVGGRTLKVLRLLVNAVRRRLGQRQVAGDY